MVYEMEYAPLGRTGLMVSRIGYGGAALGNMYTRVDTEDGITCVHKSIDEYGINYFDTSPSYGKCSMAETRLGEALAGGYRERVILATKCGDYQRPCADGESSYTVDFSGRTVRKELEGQLRRLRTDYVDVLQAHDIDKADPKALLEDVLPEMRKLRDEGKIRFLGITSRDLKCLRETLEQANDIDVVLTFGRYNLMDVSALTCFDDLQAKLGFALLNCSVLYMGLITQNFLERKHRFMHFYESRPDFEEKWKGFEKAGAMCRERGIDLGELALQFGCDCDRFDTTLISAGRTERLDQNMALINAPYDREFALQVSEILQKCSFLPAFGEREFPWRGRAGNG